MASACNLCRDVSIVPPIKAAPSIEDQFRYGLTLTQREEGLEYPFSDSNEASVSSDSAEELRLPPPLPCFDRRIHASASAPSLMQGVLSRARSSSPSRHDPKEPRGRELCQARAMAQSMPNLFASRSRHNRGIGYSVLSNSSESGDKRGAQASRARVQDFEALLEGL